MLELLAVAPEDGWAFVRSESGVVLVRPPYRRSTMVDASNEAASSAVLRYGFSPPSDVTSFDDWRDLISFLVDKVRESRAETVRELSDSGIGAQALEFAPPEVVSSFLDRIERELLPEREWGHAVRLLEALFKLPAVRTDIELSRRGVELLLASVEGSRRIAEQVLRPSDDDEQFDSAFPRVSRRYGQQWTEGYATRIAEAGMTFGFTD